MKILQYVLTSLLSVLVLFAITRLTGRRQISELTVFDYINGITIGSIAAEATFSPLSEFYRYLIAMAIFGGCSLLLSILTDHSSEIRHLLSGKPMILYQSGVFHRKAMAHLHLDLSELLMLCRNAGYFDLSTVESILMEVNGKLSILPLSPQKPATPAELRIKVPQEELHHCVILDGEVQSETLSSLEYGLDRLRDALKQQGKGFSDVFLATLTPSGRLSVYTAVDSSATGEIE